MTALRVAVIGAGPAAVYTADTLLKSDADVTVDLFEKLPAPFGLVRYGVAPDHPRIKQIVHALHRVLDRPGVRLFGNVHVGTDITLSDLREHYDAVVAATGCERTGTSTSPGSTCRAATVPPASCNGTTATPTCPGTGRSTRRRSR